MASHLCSCDSGRRRDECCGPFIDGVDFPSTALELMRARYTAYTERKIEFLATTLAPENRATFDVADAKKTAETIQWLGLEVLATTAGLEGDSYGTVTFKTRFRVQGRDDGFHELSRFRRQEGQWVYIDGDVTPLVGSAVFESSAPNKIGRNAPCPCGSGKKYKKCCGKPSPT